MPTVWNLRARIFAGVVLVGAVVAGIFAFTAFAEDPTDSDSTPVAQTSEELAYEELIAEHAQQTPGPDRLSETGRLTFSGAVTFIQVDENGKPIPGPVEGTYLGGGGWRTCEADAVVDLRDGRVATVVYAGTVTDVAVGELVRNSIGDGSWKVYRDDSGELQRGYVPGSCVDAGVP